MGGSGWEGMENTVGEKQSFIVPGALELMSFAFQRWRASFRPSQIDTCPHKEEGCVWEAERGRGGSTQKVEARGPYLGASTNLLSA